MKFLSKSYNIDRLIIFGGIAVFIFLIFGLIPTRPLKEHIKTVEIEFRGNVEGEFSKKIFEITDTAEIENIRDACGTVWISPVPSNSLEGSPSWIMRVTTESGGIHEHYIDEDEFDGGSPRDELIQLLKSKYS